MQRLSQFLNTLVIAATVSACGGGDASPAAPVAAVPVAVPTPAATCSTRDRQDWSAGVLREWYLFPETLPAALDPAPFATVPAYIDAQTATARGQGRDRFFTYLTSIADENAFIASGSSAGFGFRVSADAAARRVFIAETFEGTAAFAAGVDRTDEILAVGNDAATLRTVASIIAAEGTAGVTAAFGPSTAGTSRRLRVTGPSGTRELTIVKADFALTPISPRYGARIIDDGGRRVGYINLRTFIATADQQLRDSFATMRAQGITQFIIDFRYNGGGLVSTAELMGDLLGGNRASSEVFSALTYRPEKSANNSTKRFAPQGQSVSPVRIAFIATGATASASELVINALIPYYGANVGLIGANTFGKPVGQVAIDRSTCDDRLRVVAFSTRNSANSDAYFNGLASAVSASCAAADDLTQPLGDAREASVRTALDFLAGRSCTPIAVGQTGQSARAAASRPEMMTPLQPGVAQREVPGLF